MKNILIILMAVLFISGMGGIAQAEMYDFTIVPPTTNEDGTPLTDLAGYYFLDNGVQIADIGNVTTYQYDVPEGNHSFTVRAYDDNGNTSLDSNAIIYLIQICPSPASITATKSNQ